jgi:hypothetical protein
MSTSYLGGKITAHRTFVKAITVLMLVTAGSSFAQGIGLGTNCLVSFATVDAAKNILTNRDEFVSALSPFDRSARLKTNHEVTEREFLEFAGRSALPWLPDETNKVTTVLNTLKQRLAPWYLPFPSTILLIKTSGKEEGNASYTRQNAIVLAQRDVRAPDGGLEQLITHELFHILSRHNPVLRKQLYRIIGFTPISAIEYPEELRQRKITNPDGVQDGWAISITNGNQVLPTVPILYASAAQYDALKDGEFFNYLVFKLLVITNRDSHWQPRLVDGRPLLIEPEEAPSYFAQVGRNTHYIIHPDEILADNFVHMVNGNTNLPTPQIVMEMKNVFMQR